MSPHYVRRDEPWWEPTYRALLNNLRAHTGLAPVAEPFHCTGAAHLAGGEFLCTSPAHAVVIR